MVHRLGDPQRGPRPVPPVGARRGLGLRGPSRRTLLPPRPGAVGPASDARERRGLLMAFDLLGPLPRGVTVLEASAGTGKTYTIEGLVTRYVAERFPLRRLLVVTFTRAATAELRDRVRTRMVRVAEHLSAVIDGASPKSDDAVAALLAGGVAGVAVTPD